MSEDDNWKAIVDAAEIVLEKSRKLEEEARELSRTISSLMIERNELRANLRSVEAIVSVTKRERDELRRRLERVDPLCCCGEYESDHNGIGGCNMFRHAPEPEPTFAELDAPDCPRCGRVMIAEVVVVPEYGTGAPTRVKRSKCLGCAELDAPDCRSALANELKAQ